MENNSDEPKSLKDKLIEIMKSLVPKASDPEYRYAEALLIVFDKYAEPGSQSIKFNYKDLYELIKGEDAGRVYVSMDLLGQIEKAHDVETHKKLFDEMENIENSRLEKVKEAKAFMERVSNTLTLIVLHEQYGRDLIISELEGEIWIAFDLNLIKTTEINF